MSYNVFDDDDYYDDDDDPYYENYIPCPEVTLREVAKKWIRQVQSRWYRWRHRDEINQIPF